MLNDKRFMKRHGAPEKRGRYVLYWMQQAQRTRENHALDLAVQLANERSLPVVCCFILSPGYPEANVRHYTFMLEGLAELKDSFRELGIPFVLLEGTPPAALGPLLSSASVLVTDRGYLRHQRKWREEAEKLAARETVSFWEVDTDVVVPVEAASGKEEYSARTLRPKIHRQMEFYLRPEESPRPVLQGDLKELLPEVLLQEKPISIPDTLSRLKIDPAVGAVKRFRGGEKAAARRLEEFLLERLHRYGDSSHPEEELGSGLSPYLHFGQISPVRIARAVVREAGEQTGIREAADSFLEELVVRRELAINFVWYNQEYDRFAGMTYPWAYRTMEDHRGDPRPELYTMEDLEGAATGDPWWNAAMEEMVHTGTMQSYMRMYWCKKILEWSRTPEEAYERAILLNNRYFLDGRDANSYAGVAWCFGKHDRAWSERDVFGKLRYMNAAGLKRKFRMEGYVERVRKLKEAEGNVSD